VVEDIELLEREEESLRREKSSRMQAQLLQDILTHDIRNYVQISKSSAELLREQQQQQSQVSPLLDSIVRAADNTGDLIDRTKKLARIISQDAELHRFDLPSSIENSVRLITEANREKKILVSYSPPDLRVGPGEDVLADELLDEVFTNILSNSVRYTDGREVPIEIGLEEVSEVDGVDDDSNDFNGEKVRYWKVTIADRGRGIPDNMKSKVFTRYQNTASGSGLGLSIVYALVVQRYRGRVRIEDRVAGDPSKGTRVEVLLPR
jgi:signal transduction histidine kinase